MYQSKTKVTKFMSSVHFIEELEEPVILHISGNKLAMEQSNPATGEFNEIFLSAERVVFEFFKYDPTN